jgi:hypothetical protein
MDAIFDLVGSGNGGAGTPGPKGDTGPQGPSGLRGDTGPKGDNGIDGTSGAAGTTGPQGPQGVPGASGTPGTKGDKGDTGLTGPQGDRGLQGDTGSQGTQGVQGVAGTNGTTAYTLSVQALTSSPTDAQTIYFGNLPKAPTTTANISKVYIPKTGAIKRAEIYCYSGTAGTNESWSIYVRLNNTTDTLIAAVAAATSERVFSNASLNISVTAGNYIEIKSINPTWSTNPLTTIFGGYLYIE